MRLVEHAEWTYDEALVLTVPGGEQPAKSLKYELESEGISTKVRELPLTDPSNYRSLFEVLGDLATELVRERLRDDWEVDVLLSSGTPQAQTMWVLQVESGVLPARMIQIIPSIFVPDPHPHPVVVVDLDIEGFPSIQALHAEVARLRAAQSLDDNGLIGETANWRELKRRAARIAESDVPVLVFGETGTGKELVAQAIHSGSSRKDGPFVAENCGALDEGVLASELFGHEAGAFTGATSRRRGLFEQAHGGTLFLDEVGEMPSRVQASLLRVLQEGKLRRVGGENAVEVDVRVVAATHRDLKAKVKAGEFREDLYFRLYGASLELPPLRERAADIPFLIHAFLKDADSELELSSAALRALERYAWPGNIRELRAEVVRWTVFCDTRVEVVDLSPAILDAGPPAETEEGTLAPIADGVTLADAVEKAERGAIRAALAEFGGNLSQTSRGLGVDRNTLKRKMKKYSL